MLPNVIIGISLVLTALAVGCSSLSPTPTPQPTSTPTPTATPAVRWGLENSPVKISELGISWEWIRPEFRKPFILRACDIGFVRLTNRDGERVVVLNTTGRMRWSVRGGDVVGVIYGVEPLPSRGSYRSDAERLSHEEEMGIPRPVGCNDMAVEFVRFDRLNYGSERQILAGAFPAPVFRLVEPGSFEPAKLRFLGTGVE